MLINELENGTDIAVRVENQLEFTTKVIVNDEIEKVKSKLGAPCIVVEALRSDEKLLNFDNTKCEVIGVCEGRKYLWKNNLVIRSIPLKSGTFHIILCKEDAPTYNEREHFRLWIGLSGTAQINLSSKSVDIEVKDLSAKGIGILVDQSVKVDIGDKLLIKFADHDSPLFPVGTPKRITSFTLNATVVRQLELEDDSNQKILGCVLDKESAMITKYINAKQRSRMNLR